MFLLWYQPKLSLLLVSHAFRVQVQMYRDHWLWLGMFKHQMWDPNHQATTTLGGSCGELWAACRQRAKQCRCKVCVYVRRDKNKVLFVPCWWNIEQWRGQPTSCRHTNTSTHSNPPNYICTLGFFFFCLFKNAHGNTRFFPFQLIKGWFLRHCLKHVSSWQKTRCTCTCSICRRAW